MTEDKKYYETPKAVKIEFDYRENVTASWVQPDKPGRGWGDKNHEHHHWKDGEWK